MCFGTLETEQENEVIQDLATEEYAQEARSILIEHNCAWLFT